MSKQFQFSMFPRIRKVLEFTSIDRINFIVHVSLVWLLSIKVGGLPKMHRRDLFWKEFNLDNSACVSWIHSRPYNSLERIIALKTWIFHRIKTLALDQNMPWYAMIWARMCLGVQCPMDSCPGVRWVQGQSETFPPYHRWSFVAFGCKVLTPV